MSKPIPLKLLVHTVTVRRNLGIDEDRNVIWSEPETVAPVRCEPVKAEVLAGNGVQRDDKLTLFVDCTHSAFVPEKGMQVEFLGTAYTVREATPYFADTANVHHYEAALV
ncbi:putative minor capsid protein [Treponema socranskii]|uniref:putative minor capsid protein n=1 Tax=Treponema socranskii TaxID=53419 RepID=UPI00056E4C4D|nr:putative minor capsid protein [Treponema socranskii]